MERPGPASNVSPDGALGFFDGLADPHTPVTTREVAEGLDCSTGAARRELATLADRGVLSSKKMDTDGRVWWRSNGKDGHRIVDGDDRPELEQFGAFVSAVEDYAIFMLDPDGVVVNWNEGAERIKGYSEQDIVGEHVSVFYTDEDVDRGIPERNLERAVTEGRYEDEGWRIREDGSRFWADVVITAIGDADGELRGFTKVTRDLTEHREYQEELRQERDFSNRVLETVPVNITVFDRDGEVVRANSQAQDWFGIDDSDLDGRTVASMDYYDEDGEPIAVDELPWATVAETGEPVTDFQCQVDAPDRGRRWLSINATPLDDGGDDHIVSAMDDVTEQKEHELELERRKSELETELSGIFGRISDAFYALDEEWQFTHVNERAEELLQRPAEELVGQSLWELFPEVAEEEEVVWEKFHEAMETQEPTSFELYFDPLEFWVEASIYPSETGVSVYFRDATDRIERERELAKSRLRYQTLVENFPNGAVALVDQDLRYRTVGGSPVEENAVSGDDLEGSTIGEALSPELAELIEPLYEAALDGEASTFEDEYNGRAFQFRILPVRDDEGEVFAAMGMSQDVTEQVARERQLERYRTIVETVDDGVYTVDDGGQFTMVNDAYAEMTGFPREELVGSHVSTVVDPETVEVAQTLEEKLVSGEREQVRFESDVRTADGSSVRAEATFAMLPSDDPEYKRVGVVRNITKRVERERALQESERRYRTLVENFPEGIVALFDEDLRYTTAGGQLLDEIATDVEAAVGNTIWERHPEELATEIEPHFRDALTGEMSSFEVEYLGRDLQAYTLPVRDASDEVYAGMLVVQDVTERMEYRRRLEETVEELEESNERLEQFAYVASHDLQEPLRMISNYLQLLEGRYGDDLDQDAKEFIEFAVDGAERMRDMINDLLAYSRVDTEAGSPGPTDSRAVVDRVLDGLRLQIEEHDAEVEVGDLPTVVADDNQLEQVFQNLLSNAIKYRDDDPPRIEITATGREDQWLFRVSDNGIGIDPDHTDRIFEVFQRLHTSEEYPGTGIGLALCRKIVERHGGRIRVDSTPGEGSTFTFTLPKGGDS